MTTLVPSAPVKAPVFNHESHGKKFNMTWRHPELSWSVQVSAVLLCSLLLSCQGAPAPLIDPISSSFALGGLTGSFALAEGKVEKSVT